MPQLSSGPVFMSYSRRDNVIMRRVVAFLRKKGIKVWVDDEKLIPGTPIWEEEIEKAIINSSAVVVVLSPDSKGSEWVRREISLADQYRKRVFPVLAIGDEEASITLRLINRQFVDIRENEDVALGSLETALSAYLQELSEQDQKLAKEKVRQPTIQKEAEEAHLPKAQNEEPSKLDTNEADLLSSRQALITLGWAIGGAISGVIYNLFGGVSGAAIGGAIGGLITAIALENENHRYNWKNIFWVALAWAIGAAVGWMIGEVLTEAIGMAIGFAIGAILSMAILLSIRYIFFDWKSMAWIVLAWAIGAAIGWYISSSWMIDELSVDYATSWAIGTAIGWSIAGFVMGWQLTRR